MSTWFRSVMLAIAMASVAEPALGQASLSRELVPGKPLSSPPGKKGQADIYYFVGEEGARHNFNLVSKGEAEITLFGPDGEEMLHAAGSGTIKLDAVLSLLDVHTIAVLRRDQSVPYTLVMTASVPTLGEAAFASNVGDVQIDEKGGRIVRCWIDPGVRQGFRSPTYNGELILAADRKSVITLLSGPGLPMFASSESYAIEGEELVTTIKIFPGSEQTRRNKLPPIDAPRRRRDYSGYFCPGSEPQR